MEDYKHYLNEGADENERQTAQQVLEGLSTLRIEHQVKAVEAARKTYFQQQFRQRLLFATAVLAVVALMLWYWLGQHTANTSPVNEQVQNTPAEQPMAQQPTPPAATNPAIAAAPKLSKPRYLAPHYTNQTRGANQAITDDPKRQAMLNQLWYTEYPLTGLTARGSFIEVDRLLRKRDFETAYIRLGRLERKQPDSDTLRYMKGYCLLEMGQSDVALTYFGNIKKRLPSWKPQLQWYRALATLHKGDKVNALSQFRQIAKITDHPYQPQSQLAIELLE